MFGFSLPTYLTPKVLTEGVTAAPQPPPAPAAPPAQKGFAATDTFEAPKPASTSAASTSASPTTVAALPPKPHTPAQAKIAADYKAGALADLSKPANLAVINRETNANPPITAADAKKVIDNTDVRVLSAADYATLKTATGGQPGNPATHLGAADRALLPTTGAENLARSRVPKGTDPTPQQIAQARAELQQLDPGAFDKNPKGVVYANEGAAKGAGGSPTETKVAAHEMTHALLESRGIHGEDTQHEVIEKLGWMGLGKPGSYNWSTKPGEGTP